MRLMIGRANDEDSLSDLRNTELVRRQILVVGLITGGSQPSTEEFERFSTIMSA